MIGGSAWKPSKKVVAEVVISFTIEVAKAGAGSQEVNDGYRCLGRLLRLLERFPSLAELVRLQDRGHSLHRPTETLIGAFRITPPGRSPGVILQSQVFTPITGRSKCDGRRASWKIVLTATCPRASSPNGPPVLRFRS